MAFAVQNAIFMQRLTKEAVKNGSQFIMGTEIKSDGKDFCKR